MLTLTLDPKEFESPFEGWSVITGGRYIGRLMRDLRVVWWVWVLEFQKSGWPHWHMLVDLASCPGGRIDLARAWELWRDRWELGGLDLSYKKTVAQSGLHGVHYITKYLVKPPRNGFPSWVMQSNSIRFIQGCRALGPLVSDKHNRSGIIGPEKEGVERGPRRSLKSRVDECSESIMVFQRMVDMSTGELRTGWVCKLRGGRGVLGEIQSELMIDGHEIPGVSVDRRVLAVEDERALSRVCKRYGLWVDRGHLEVGK